jgi:hypothetical protein
MSDWDWSRIDSLLDQVSDRAGHVRMRCRVAGPAASDVRDLLRSVDMLFRDLRVVKSLLVRERSSRD